MPKGPKQPHSVDPRRLPSGRWKGRVVVYDANTGKRREMTQTLDTKEDAHYPADGDRDAYSRSLIAQSVNKNYPTYWQFR